MILLHHGHHVYAKNYYNVFKVTEQINLYTANGQPGLSELWSKNFHFNSKTQRQMFLLHHGHHVCAPQKGTNMASPYKALLLWVAQTCE